MISEAPSKYSASAKKRSAVSANPPSEPPAKIAAVTDQIFTPEKPFPQRSRNRSIAFSLKEVRQVARGLQRASDRSDLAQSSVDLWSAEQLGVGPGPSSSSKSSKAKTPAVEIPEKYEVLCEFFNCMESSIRLLRLKGSMSTFPNICTSIQHLTERRFTYAHLAQLKYIMPEAIIIKKILVHDESTCCMKPELQVNLQADAVTNNINGKSESGYTILRAVFRERLVGFIKNHPEGNEVPEEQLPHPFNQTKPSTQPNVNINVNAANSGFSSSTASQEQVIVPSHMPQSFQRRFSRRLSNSNSEKTPLSCVNEASPTDKSCLPVASSPMKCTSKPPLYKQSVLSSPISTISSSKSGINEEVGQLTRPVNYSHKEPIVQGGTPAKEVSTPLRLLSSTPEICSSKRCPTTPSCDSSVLKKSLRRSARTKLFMTPKKGEKAQDKECEDRSFSPNDDVLNILPETLLRSIREKEQKSVQEKEASVTNRKQKLIASLPNVFDMILLIFQSWNRSVMTKHELIQKLISNHCKIVDRSEVEEQLKLLLDLVPDWISEKVAYSGDVLCCVNNLSIPEEIRQRLSEAV
ncbi:CDT1-like protein a, chloroplastic [Canna indica]|uniref:CDT1-like protein a, chloroplastic n=1 Tax=Canna indica TaxID=4628 RepID=A0AAQ3JQ10_9LILI|nr:CDT1-like protein a, chloroplastic [Canna indica]